jgi:hypothetical protein
MKTKSGLVVIICLLNFSVFSQQDSTAYQKFYKEFVDFYAYVAKPPLKNYYDALSTTAKYNFNPFNPLFIKVLASTSKINKVDEPKALAILFNQVFTQFKKEDIWITIPDIYQNKKPLFELYNTVICACYTLKVKANNTTQDLLKASRDCNYKLAKDTTFLTAIKNVGGDSAMRDFIKFQQYFSLYNYANCNIVNSKQNESLLDGAVYEQYITGIAYYKSKESENVMRYYKDKKWDSLAIIFPGYKKFIPELNRIQLKLKASGGIARADFNMPMTGSIPKIVVTYFKNKKDELYGELVMSASAYALNATIVSIRFNELKPGKKDSGEEIIMSPVAN